MPEFVEFTKGSTEEPGRKVAINVDHIIYCVPAGDGTKIVLVGNDEMIVRTSFEQVLSAIGPRTDSYGQRVS
jgi:hypothetical protein